MVPRKRLLIVGIALVAIACIGIGMLVVIANGKHCEPYVASSITAHLNDQGKIVYGPVATTYGCR